MFQPIQGQSTQQKTVTVNFTDDNTALEDSEILRFSLSNPISTTLFEPSTVDIVITDDDSGLIHFKYCQVIIFFTFRCNYHICLFFLQLH